MGQYRQWLYYREVDQQLQAQRAQQQQLLQQLLTEAEQLEQLCARYDDPVTNNPLVRALQAEHQHARAIAAIEQQAQLTHEKRKPIEAPTIPQTPSHTEQEIAKESVMQPLQRAANAPSLAIWGEAPVPATQASRNTEAQQYPTPQSPTPIAEQQQPTLNEPESTHEVPAQTIASKPGEPGELPIDQQSERVNQLISRWAQRWHRENAPTNSKPAGNERR